MRGILNIKRPLTTLTNAERQREFRKRKRLKMQMESQEEKQEFSTPTAHMHGDHSDEQEYGEGNFPNDNMEDDIPPADSSERGEECTLISDNFAHGYSSNHSLVGSRLISNDLQESNRSHSCKELEIDGNLSTVESSSIPNDLFDRDRITFKSSSKYNGSFFFLNPKLM